VVVAVEVCPVTVDWTEPTSVADPDNEARLTVYRVRKRVVKEELRQGQGVAV
jgi:hypothetical protein